MVEQNFKAAIKVADRFYIMARGRWFLKEYGSLLAAEDVRKNYLEVWKPLFHSTQREGNDENEKVQLWISGSCSDAGLAGFRCGSGHHQNRQHRTPVRGPSRTSASATLKACSTPPKSSMRAAGCWAKKWKSSPSIQS